MLTAFAVCGACAGGSDQGGAGEQTGAPVASEGATPASPVSSVGTLSFAVDGRPKLFEHLRAADNNYTQFGSTIRAMPSADAVERFAITFLSIDLKKIEPPVELPLARAAGQPADPLAAMASVGFSFIDEMGREWAGPGRVRVVSFGPDGTLEGTFTDVIVPNTQKQQLPNVRLTDGSFRVSFDEH